MLRALLLEPGLEPRHDQRRARLPHARVLLGADDAGGPGVVLDHIDVADELERGARLGRV
jgi:hypothetical protein